jgi:hypothetical protein
MKKAGNIGQKAGKAFLIPSIRAPCAKTGIQRSVYLCVITQAFKQQEALQSLAVQSQRATSATKNLLSKKTNYKNYKFLNKIVLIYGRIISALN